MFASRRLLSSCRITLFSRDNCGLCAEAKDALSRVQKPFELKEVDLARPEARSWKDLYDFDIPVIHISKGEAAEESVQLAAKATRLMHRFSPEEVEAKMAQVEQS